MVETNIFLTKTNYLLNHYSNRNLLFLKSF